MSDTTFRHFPWLILITWYKENGRKYLPWRQYHTVTEDQLLYRVWLSEILLQQTQANRVIDFFEKILYRFPDINSLSRTNYETFFPYYQGLGYYSRARNLLKTAQIITSDYHGIFPFDRELLKKLPGVGDYTANAIFAFGFGEAALSWDTNLEKVFSRYYNGTKDKRLSKSEKENIEEDFISFISKVGNPKETVRDINNALMDFSALVDLKNSENINWDNYIFTESIFYKTRGHLEDVTVKKTNVFPIPDATIILTLHENHKVYYSENPKEYEPFILMPGMSRNTRDYIKKYFKTKYGLELSVRPIHKKWLSNDGKPYIAVNAQIQAGQASFFQWKKDAL